MIGDLIVALSLEFPRQGIEFDTTIAERSIGVTGDDAVKVTKVTTTADGTFDLASVSTIGYVLLKNLEGFLVDTPAAPTITNVGTAGAATWTYKIVARYSTAYTVAGAAGSTATGNATLTGSNYNHIKWLPIDDATSYDVYRTASGGTPSSTGKIGNVLTTATEVDSSGITYVYLNDTALVGDATTAPATTPFDYTVDFGLDGATYGIRLRGQDFALIRWNGAAIHHKALFNSSRVLAVIIEA